MKKSFFKWLLIPIVILIIASFILYNYIQNAPTRIGNKIKADHDLIVSIISNTFTNCVLENKMEVWSNNQWEEAECNKT